MGECTTIRINLCCSFCKADQKQVEILISGPNVYICDQCVALSVDVITTRRAEVRAAARKAIKEATDA